MALSHTQDKINRLNKLLGEPGADIVKRFKWDEVGLYSMTPLHIAHEIAIAAFDLPDIVEASSVFIANGGIGGDTIAFGSIFRAVTAAELHIGRSRMLRANLELFGIDDCEVIASYYQLALKKFHDIIYCDPPWGGVNYKISQKLRLGVKTPNGDQTLEGSILELAKFTRYCIVKLPINYDMDWFGNRLKLKYRTCWIRIFNAPFSCQFIALENLCMGEGFKK